MPLTAFQSELGRLLAVNRSEDSYLAGGAAILATPNTRRFSHDIDYFHDSAQRVASAWEADQALLLAHGYRCELEISQPGYIRAVISRDASGTKVEWAQDSTWRFLPVMRSDAFGYQLHPLDLATNKVLALAGRDEPRDLLETKTNWLAALDEADGFARRHDPVEAGCLYWSPSQGSFVSPQPGMPGEIVPHFGRPGGVLPRITG